MSGLFQTIMSMPQTISGKPYPWNWIRLK